MSQTCAFSVPDGAKNMLLETSLKTRLVDLRRLDLQAIVGVFKLEGKCRGAGGDFSRSRNTTIAERELGRSDQAFAASAQ